MPLPRWVARFNKRFTNRILEPMARRSSGFGVVEHIGRTSGRHFQTPVNVFDADGAMLIALTYGPTADWFRNVQAGGSHIVTKGTTFEIAGVRLVDRGTAFPYLPRLVRLALRILTVTDFALLSVSADNPSQ